jgi:citrate lyase subunit beta/citryl-CoA lyase
MHRSILITTCHSETLMEKQARSHADVAFLELEDGVPLDAKVEARARAINALKHWDYGTKERWVRINQPSTVEGMRDIIALVEGRPEALIPAKLRTANEVIAIDYLLSRREEELGLPVGQIKICPMVETGLALINLRDLIAASPRIKGFLLGTGDLTVDLGMMIMPGERELDFARGHLVATAHALGVECFDVASLPLDQPELVYEEAQRARNFGFDGKACISPTQIDPIHRGFAPPQEEIARALRLLKATVEAAEKGASVFAFEGQMVDGPVVKGAERTLQQAGIDV